MYDYCEVLETAIKRGNTLRMLRTSGGLHVVRIERGEELVAYGEHPLSLDAMSHAAEEYLSGPRPYSQVYGKMKPHYVTGTTEQFWPLDSWLQRGRKLRVELINNEFVAHLFGHEELRLSKEIRERAVLGEIVAWRSRRRLYEASPDPSIRCEKTGRPAIVVKVIEREKGEDAQHDSCWPVEKVGHSKTIALSIERACAATENEVI